MTDYDRMIRERYNALALRCDELTKENERLKACARVAGITLPAKADGKEGIRIKNVVVNGERRCVLEMEGFEDVIACSIEGDRAIFFARNNGAALVKFDLIETSTPEMAERIWLYLNGTSAVHQKLEAAEREIRNLRNSLHGAWVEYDYSPYQLGTDEHDALISGVVQQDSGTCGPKVYLMGKAAVDAIGQRNDPYMASLAELADLRKCREAWDAVKELRFTLEGSEAGKFRVHYFAGPYITGWHSDPIEAVLSLAKQLEEREVVRVRPTELRIREARGGGHKGMVSGQCRRQTDGYLGRFDSP